MMPPRRALLVGADRPFGAGVAARLRGARVALFEHLAAVPDGVSLDMLVADLTLDVAETPFRAVTDDDFRGSLGNQLYAFVAAVQMAVPRLTAGGAIVQIMPRAYLGAWGGVHVAASAAACVAMARSMAIELAPRGIRVNSVAAGSPGDDGQVRDVAATAVWLAGTDSAAVTGETLLADRGASLQMAQAARR